MTDLHYDKEHNILFKTPNIQIPEFPWTRRAAEKAGKEGNGYTVWILEKEGSAFAALSRGSEDDRNTGYAP